MDKEGEERSGRTTPEEGEQQRTSTPKKNIQGLMIKILNTPKETLRKIRENITSPMERGEDEITQFDEEENEEIREARIEIRGQREEMNKTDRSLKEVEIRAQQIQEGYKQVEDNWHEESEILSAHCGGMCRERERDHIEVLKQREVDKKKIEDLEEELNNYEYQLQQIVEGKEYTIQEYKAVVEENQRTLNIITEEKRKIEEEKGEVVRRIEKKEEYIKEMERKMETIGKESEGMKRIQERLEAFQLKIREQEDLLNEAYGELRKKDEILNKHKTEMDTKEIKIREK